MIPGHTYEGIDFRIAELQDTIRYEERYATDTTSPNREFVAQKRQELIQHTRELDELKWIKRRRDILGRWYERLTNPSRKIRLAEAHNRWWPKPRKQWMPVAMGMDDVIIGRKICSTTK